MSMFQLGEEVVDIAQRASGAPWRMNSEVLQSTGRCADAKRPNFAGAPSWPNPGRFGLYYSAANTPCQIEGFPGCQLPNIPFEKNYAFHARHITPPHI